jgi:hypothetical protein
MFDEQPDGDPHGECAAEIHRLQAENEKFCAAFADLLSVRDQFAKVALPQFLELEVTGVWNQSLGDLPSKRDHAALVARASYFMADAMLAARAAGSAALPPPPPEPLSGETEAQREEVCAAWADLPDSLRCHPGLKRLYRALGGLDMERLHAAVPHRESDSIPRESVSGWKADKLGSSLAWPADTSTDAAGVPESDSIGAAPQRWGYGSANAPTILQPMLDGAWVYWEDVRHLFAEDSIGRAK